MRIDHLTPLTWSRRADQADVLTAMTKTRVATEFEFMVLGTRILSYRCRTRYGGGRQYWTSWAEFATCTNIPWRDAVQRAVEQFRVEEKAKLNRQIHAIISGD